jgi:putative aldouronate transport system substrate-binding protein
MRKHICLLLVVFCFIAMISCSKSEKPPKGDTTTAPEENPFEEFFEITWLTQNGPNYKDGRWDELEIEEMFNVDLQVWPLDCYSGEQMAALIAAGDIPDFFYMPAAPRDPQGLYDEKVIRSIPLDMIKNYLPGQYEVYERVPIGFRYNLVKGTTDQYLGITAIQFNACQYFYDITAINLDWLEAIGYSMDMSKLYPVRVVTEGFEELNDNIFFGEGNFTFEEMNDMLRKFTENDPDGNGIDDTYGMMYILPNSSTTMTQEGLFGFAYDVNYLYKDKVTGDTVPYYAYTPYKDYLQWVSENLQKGYMKKLPGEQAWNLEYQQISRTNKMGILQCHRDGYLRPTTWGYGELPPTNILLNTDPDARFVMGPMFRGPEGVATDATYGIDPFGEGLYRCHMVGVQVSDEKLIRLLTLLQYTSFESEYTHLRYNYGIEGIHWRWEGEPYKSVRIQTPDEELPEEYRNQGELHVFSTWAYFSTADFETYNAVENGWWSAPAYMYAYNLYEKYALNPDKYLSSPYMGPDLYQKYVEMNAEYTQTINPIVNDFRNRALNGQISDFNTEWAHYIEQLYAAGLQKMVDEIFNNPDFINYDPGDKFKLRGRP